MFAEGCKPWGLALVAILVVAGAARSDDGAATADWALGQVQARGAIRLRVPAGPIRSVRPLVLERHLAEGARVRAGDELAAFAFDADGRRARAERRLRRAEARSARGLAAQREKLQALESARQLAAVEQSKAALEKAKAGVLSKRDAALVQLAARQATYEVEALNRLIAAQRAVVEAEQARVELRLARAREEIARETVLAARHRLVAPGAGRIHWDRRLCDGERLVPGAPVATFAADEGLEVVFRVPAERQAEYRPGRAVTVQSLSGDRETYARVVSGAGTLAERDERGNGWIRVRAELPADARGFAVNQPIRVGP